MTDTQPNLEALKHDEYPWARGPVREYRSIVQDSNDPGYVNRVLIGVPTIGTFRVEWVQARYGQVVPMNWSHVEMQEYINSYFPMRYQVADAQNMIVKACIEKDFEWCLLYEHDVLPPPDAFWQLNEIMREGKIPVVSGLYFSRSRPSEPMTFRGKGAGVYTDWKMGDDVWVDGCPTGFLLIHRSVLKAMWDDSPEYSFKNQTARQVFATPRALWVDPESGQYNTISGTSDLNWCWRVIEGDYLRKAGWGDFVDHLPDPRYPFLIRTRLFCRHINVDGTQFP